jgi:hypothetical protein
VGIKCKRESSGDLRYIMSLMYYKIIDFRYDFNTFIIGYGRRIISFRVYEMAHSERVTRTSANRVRAHRNYDNPAAWR